VTSQLVEWTVGAIQLDGDGYQTLVHDASDGFFEFADIFDVL